MNVGLAKVTYTYWIPYKVRAIAVCPVLVPLLLALWGDDDTTVSISSLLDKMKTCVDTSQQTHNVGSMLDQRWFNGFNVDPTLIQR